MLLTINITEKQYEELCPQERVLIDAAKEATQCSYAPYSKFNVGAAVELEDGTIVKGANQENAAFSVTLCAERTAIFAAQASAPEKAITAIALAAKTVHPGEGDIPTCQKKPVSPCGSCRQVITEMEQRYRRPIRILMYGEEVIYIAETIKDLLPLSFTEY